MEDVCDAVLMFEYPFECVSHAVEQDRRRAEAKREAFINVVPTFPVNTKQLLVFKADRADYEGMFQV